MEVLKGSDHASAAVGRRSSLLYSLMNYVILFEADQPWTPQQIHLLIEDRYNVSYHPSHLSRKLRAAGMRYAKPRPMDPRRPVDAKEIFAERLNEALGGGGHETGGDEPLVFGFF